MDQKGRDVVILGGGSFKNSKSLADESSRVEAVDVEVSAFVVMGWKFPRLEPSSQQHSTSEFGPGARVMEVIFGGCASLASWLDARDCVPAVPARGSHRAVAGLVALAGAPSQRGRSVLVRCCCVWTRRHLM